MEGMLEEVKTKKDGSTGIIIKLKLSIYKVI